LEGDVADRCSAPSNERHLPVELAMKRTLLWSAPPSCLATRATVTKTAIPAEAGREKGRYDGVDPSYRPGTLRNGYALGASACAAVRVTTPSGMPSLKAVTPKVELRALAPVAVSLATVP
jgi:hypothetical protein